MKHCILCKWLDQHSIEHGKPVDYMIYNSLDQKTRVEICENKKGKPVILLTCSHYPHINYQCQSDCKISDNCLLCQNNFMISTYNKIEDLPKWLSRDENIEFPITVVFCNRKKKGTEFICSHLCSKFEVVDG